MVIKPPSSEDLDAIDWVRQQNPSLYKRPLRSYSASSGMSSPLPGETIRQKSERIRKAREAAMANGIEILGPM